MPDIRLEPYYDIFLSIFLGIIVIISIHNMYDSPRSVIVEKR